MVVVSFPYAGSLQYDARFVNQIAQAFPYKLNGQMIGGWFERRHIPSRESPAQGYTNASCLATGDLNHDDYPDLLIGVSPDNDEAIPDTDGQLTLLACSMSCPITATCVSRLQRMRAFFHYAFAGGHGQKNVLNRSVGRSKESRGVPKSTNSQQ